MSVLDFALYIRNAGTFCHFWQIYLQSTGPCGDEIKIHGVPPLFSDMEATKGRLGS